MAIHRTKYYFPKNKPISLNKDILKLSGRPKASYQDTIIGTITDTINLHNIENFL